MKEVDCCYNCRNCSKPFYLEGKYFCVKAVLNVLALEDILGHGPEYVEPNNVCEHWEHK